MMVFELLYLGMLLTRVVAWFVRVLVMLHLAMIIVGLPAGLLVRAGLIEDVDVFALVSCGWAAVLLCAWRAAVVASRKRAARLSPSPRTRPRRPGRAALVRGL